MIALFLKDNSVRKKFFFFPVQRIADNISPILHLLTYSINATDGQTCEKKKQNLFNLTLIFIS